MYKNNLTMSQAFYNTVNSFPERTAQVFNPDLYGGDNGGKFTWREMADRVELIASGLLSMGLNKGERVGIMAKNSPYWTHTDVAVINCGGVLVTIYPTLSLQEVTYIVNDSESRYLLVGDKDILNRILPGISSMPTLQKIIILDLNYKTDHPMVINLTQLMDLGRQNLKKIKKNMKSDGQAIKWKTGLPYFIPLELQDKAKELYLATLVFLPAWMALMHTLMLVDTP